MLEDKDLLTQFEEYKKAAPWAEWKSSYLSFLQETHQTPVEQWRTAGFQKKLWSARPITGVGPGESVNVSVVFSDAAIVERIVGLHTKAWPRSPKERRKALSEEFNSLLNLVAEKTKRRPFAKLLRLFAVIVPDDFLTTMNSISTNKLGELLLPESDEKRDIVETHVAARERIRQVFGAEKGFVDTVERNVFTWWLVDPSRSMSAATTVQPESPKLDVWEYARQKKFIVSISGYGEAYREIVREAEGGIGFNDLVESLKGEGRLEAGTANTLTNHTGALKKFGFVDVDNGQVKATKDGIAFLNPDDGSELLTRRFLERLYPAALLLRIVKYAPRTSAEMNSVITLLQPDWGTKASRQYILSWMRSLTLIEKRGDIYELGEAGLEWEEQLPDTLTLRPDSGHEIELETVTTVLPGVVAPPLKRIFEEMSGPGAKLLVIPSSQVTAIHSAFHCRPAKRFVLLSGLSGTGKTQVILSYARAYCRALGLPEVNHIKAGLGSVGLARFLRVDGVFERTPRGNDFSERPRT